MLFVKLLVVKINYFEIVMRFKEALYDFPA